MLEMIGELHIGYSQEASDWITVNVRWTHDDLQGLEGLWELGQVRSFCEAEAGTGTIHAEEQMVNCIIVCHRRCKLSILHKSNNPLRLKYLNPK